MIVVPFVLYKIIKPEVTSMPDAPAEARKTLAALGGITRDQKVVGVTFLGMVLLWGLSSTFGIDPTAIAFLGLGILIATNVLTATDIAKEGDVLSTFIWFAILFTMSDQLNKLGFMEFLGERLVMRLGGLPVPVAAIVLVVAYVALHYLFVSQTAHLLALFSVFLGVGIKLGAFHRRCWRFNSYSRRTTSRRSRRRDRARICSLRRAATSRRESSTRWGRSTPCSAWCCFW